MRVALAHDSLIQNGGAERVLAALHEMYPDAPIFTLAYRQETVDEIFGNSSPVIVASPLQYFYKRFGHFMWTLPAIPWALRAFDFSKFDVVISSSSMFMKGIRAPRGCVHIEYCHTPPRFLWTERGSYSREEVPAAIRWLGIDRAILGALKKWDYRAAQRVNFFIANSRNVQARIKKFYGRDSEVVYPFVDVDFFYPTREKEGYFLVAGRIQKHKRVGMVVEAFNANGMQLHVVGDGRQRLELEQHTAENVTFLGHVDDEILRDEYSGASALIFPQDEDFGIVPLEAMACGTPVVAFGAGGVRETVVPGKTGIFFDEQKPASLQAALDKFAALGGDRAFLAEDLYARAEEFSRQRFEREIFSFVERTVGGTL
jgi:glycosyltransferase involved in cell wall biosynthesis